MPSKPPNAGEILVRVKGLEPPHLAALGPKPSASTNSATPATGALLAKPMPGCEQKFQLFYQYRDCLLTGCQGQAGASYELSSRQRRGLLKTKEKATG